jgi:hypothetical protein
MPYRIMKAKTRNSSRPVLDSVHGSLREANERLKTLRGSYPNSGHGKMCVWMEEADESDPKGYRRPPHGQWRNYDSPGPQLVGGHGSRRQKKTRTQ